MTLSQHDRHKFFVSKLILVVLFKNVPTSMLKVERCHFVYGESGTHSVLDKNVKWRYKHDFLQKDFFGN